ncbi:glutamate--tRNA ligase [Candidatus Dojkabacteria bacterium]|uniref:Glutamate--tRNA ligase n=1 Tax=Candidatus Dojkabacteria bacterium TaxID=2099670 RepID=A0A3M0YZK3_9BACT|nr:MAG: glutamate--tRNA ligase [Candidatus Dojkabacteria bacterium]
MVRTRIAPSPTGPQIHIGNLRTALFSYMWAKKNNGEFILRIEDTDRKRYVPGTVEGLLKVFEDLGIMPDRYPSKEDIDEMENFKFSDDTWIFEDYLDTLDDKIFENKFIQTQRLKLYQKYARRLLREGWLYACFLSSEELEKVKRSLPKHQPFRSPHRFMSPKEVDTRISRGDRFVLRLNVEKCIKEFGVNLDYEDLVLGKMSFDLSTVDDQVMIKSNGIPTYHFAVVIDDYLMGITHPIRGYSWLPSTPKQVLLYKALKWEVIPFGHATDILDPSGGKLSKRKGAVYVSEFLKQGYLPDALLNFVSFLGWKPKITYSRGEKEREIFDFQELVSLFNIENISKTNPVFDRAKLVWYNKQYLKMKSNQELSEIFREWIRKWRFDDPLSKFILDDHKLDAKLELLKERSDNLLNMFEQISFFYLKPNNIDWSIKQLADVLSNKRLILLNIKKLFESFDEDTSKWRHEDWERGMRNIADVYKVKHGDAFMLCRVALVGSPISPPLFESAVILGKKEVTSRLYDAAFRH